jgi:dipeptidyl aminopeptidase/acylaminoacyl peptidase
MSEKPTYLDFLPPLIPREVLFSGHEKSNPQISPCGKYLTYLAPDANKVMQIWLRQLQSRAGHVMLTNVVGRSIREYSWTYQLNGSIIFQQDVGGNEQWHLFHLDIATRETKDLTPFEGVQARMTQMFPLTPDSIYVALNLTDKAVHDVYCVNLRTGAVDLQEANPGGIYWWLADSFMVIRAAVAVRNDGGKDLLVKKAVGKSPWRVLMGVAPGEEILPLSFTGPWSHENINVLTNKDSDVTRILSVNIESGLALPVLRQSAYDAAGEQDILVNAQTGHIEAVAYCRSKLEWEVVDSGLQADFAFLEKFAAQTRSELKILSRDLQSYQHKQWVISLQSDNAPTEFFLYERSGRDYLAGTLEKLFVSKPQLRHATLGSMHHVQFSARDGLTLRGYLTVPVGVPSKNLPAVLLVHGGPWSRDKWGLNSRAKWLANRGYAVLQVNFRGSTGYGKQFMDAGNREWGGKMQDDLTDAVCWLVEQGIADPKRIAIFGGSYGGYATLCGLTFTPDLFACGVDLYGPSDLVAMLRDMPAYWSMYKSMWKTRLGDPEEDREFLLSRSPLYFADRVTKPLFVVQGKNDKRIAESQSTLVVEALRYQDIPVTYLSFANEGHGIVDPANNMQMYAHIEAFLATHLGGRCEPIEDVFGATGVFL